jgi:putative phage-type endonuclease
MTTPDRADWLEWRREGVGASDVAAIVGLSPYASAWSVWAEKVGLTVGQAETGVMEAGRWLELAICPWFAERTGLHVAGAQTRCTHPKERWMRATVDGFIVESHPVDWDEQCLDDPLGILEIKTVARWGRWTEIPAHYQTQGQWQMAVTGLPQVWFAVLHSRQLEVYELPRDDADIALLTDRASAFWHDHVLTGGPPPVDGSDATLRALGQVYPESTPGASRPLDDVSGAVLGLQAAREDKRAAEAAEKACKAILQAALQDAEEGTVAGQRAVTWRTQDRHSIDVERLRIEEPDVAKRYTTISSHRVLRTHPIKELT